MVCMYICINDSETYPCNLLSKRLWTEAYKNTKRNTSALARTVRSVAVTLARFLRWAYGLFLNAFTNDALATSAGRSFHIFAPWDRPLRIGGEA